jgi:hypothetical protein
MTSNSIDLGEVEPEESYTFPPPERRVITQAYDLSISTLVDQWETRSIRLPEIQREYVWDNARASRLIESLILNIPIPVLYFSETTDAIWEVIDGHQRINTVVKYLSNQFRLGSLMVVGEHKGKRFHELPEKEQRYIKNRTMRAVVLSPDSHPNIKFEVFERLNTGSMSLNAQELRNSLYRGELNNLFKLLVDDINFREILGTRIPKKRMVDEELVLRFFAMRKSLPEYRAPLKVFLNNYMREWQNPNSDELNNLTATFKTTVSKVRSGMGANAFRLITKNGKSVGPALNRALFDAQMLAFSWAKCRPDQIDPSRVWSALQDIYEDEVFVDSVQLATGNRTKTLFRIGKLVEGLRSAGLEVNPPENIDILFRREPSSSNAEE